MRHILWIGAAVFALTAASASAAVFVVGGAAAESCYQSATSERYTRNDLQTCSQALAEEPLSRRDRAATLVNRGIIYLHRGNNTLALADFDAAIELQPELAEGHTNRAAALLEMQDYQGALEAVSRSLELNPLQPEKAYYISGVAHEELGQIAAAYHAYRRAAEIAPDWQVAQRELSRFRVTSR